MLRFLALILAVTAPILGRTFNNPILGEGNFSDPGAIKVDKTYYIVTSTNDTLPEKMTIFWSPDLTSWRQTGYIFYKSNIPRWSVQELPFLSPRIHPIGKNYHVYFTATDSTTKMQSIGVAVAPHPLGPYTPTDRPLLSYPDKHVKDASIIDVNDDNYLIWTTNNSIRARLMNSNGLSFYASYSTELISRNTDGSDIFGASYYGGQFYYLLYSENYHNNQSIHIARSSYPLGPYYILVEPLMVSYDGFEAPGYASFIKDVADQNDLILFHARRNSESGLTLSNSIILASVSWKTDPYGRNEYWPKIDEP